MRCYRAASGALTTNRREAIDRRVITIACGQCIGCRLSRAEMWSLRCKHEAMFHEENCFLTLTYDDDHLPRFETIEKEALQAFIKRLRKRLGDKKVRYYAVGEYGSQTQRPHYHVCLFGHEFEDQQFFKKTRKDSRIYTSETLSKLWPFGFSSIGELNKFSAGYAARYCTKILHGAIGDAKYLVVNEHGEIIFEREKEFAIMSRRPGLGFEWYQRYKEETYRDDFIIFNGRKCSVPRYYDKLYALEDPERYAEVVAKRLEKVDQESEDRLWQREYCTYDRLERNKGEL